MEIIKRKSEKVLELLVRGRIDAALANQLELELLGAIRDGAETIWVDLSEAQSLGSAGIRVLAQYYRQMKNNQKTLRIVRPSPQAESVLSLTGFQDLILR